MVTDKEIKDNKTRGNKTRRRNAAKPLIVEGEAVEVKAGEAMKKDDIESQTASVQDDNEASSGNRTTDKTTDEIKADSSKMTSAHNKNSDEQDVQNSPVDEKKKDDGENIQNTDNTDHSSISTKEDEKPQGIGLVWIVGAAVIGGFAALALQFAIENAGILQFGPSARIAEVKKQVTILQGNFIEARNQLGQRIAYIEKKSSRSVDKTQNNQAEEIKILGRIKALESSNDQLALLSEKISNNQAFLKDLGGRIDLLEAVPSSLKNNATDPGQATELKQNRPREKTQTMSITLPQLDKTVQQIKKQFDSITQTVAAHDTSLEVLGHQIKEWGNASANIKTVVDEIKAVDMATLANTDAYSTLQTTFNNMKATIQTTSQAFDGLREEAALLTNRIDAIEKSQHQAAHSNTGALAIGVLQLRNTIDQGKPFANEYEALIKLGANKETMEVLSAYKARHVPTDHTLAEAFKPVARAILSNNNETKETDLMGRFLSSARSIVTIRPSSGIVNGNSLEAQTARIAAALDRSDLMSALDEWKQLPETARSVSKDWASGLQARVEVNQLIDILSASLLSSSNGQ